MSKRDNKTKKIAKSLASTDTQKISEFLPSPNINLNFNQSDENTSDYFYCWALFGCKPIKDSFFSFFDTKLFFDWIKELEISDDNIICNKEIISDIDIYIINSKYLIKVSDSIYISLIQFTEIYKNDDMEELDSDKIGGIHIYYKSKEDINFVEIIKEKLFDIEINQDAEEVDTKKEIGLRVLKYDSHENKFTSIPIDIKPDIDSENIDIYYNDDTFKQVKKWIKKLNKTNKGLSIIYGDRGCGKTSILTYVANKLGKKVIFVPNTIIEHTLYNTEFVEFLKYNTNSVIIYDDCENQITSKINHNSIINILGLTDGMLSNLFNCNVILSYNSNLNSLDKDLIESNNIIDIIEVSHLTKEKASELSAYLKVKDHKSPNKLINIIKERKDNYKKIGFSR